MLPDHKKPMATVPASPIAYDIAASLATLRQNAHVEAVYTQWCDDMYVVWVGIHGDNKSARKAAYNLEDEVSERFPQVLFDFHVIALPPGRETQEYVSNAQIVFQRSA
jgi:hypothetical protein